MAKAKAKAVSAETVLKNVAKIFDTERRIAGSKATVSDNAYYNLEGAIYSIEFRKGVCDSISMSTLKRVARQLGLIETWLAPYHVTPAKPRPRKRK